MGPLKFKHLNAGSFCGHIHIALSYLLTMAGRFWPIYATDFYSSTAVAGDCSQEESAHDNIPDVYMVWSLIKDVRNVRFHKVETDLEAFNGSTIAVKINNLSAMEVNIVCPFIGRALQAFYKHDSTELVPNPERVSDRRPQVVKPRAL